MAPALAPCRVGPARRSRSESVSQRSDRSPEPGEGSLEPRRPPARPAAPPRSARRGSAARLSAGAGQTAGGGAWATRLAWPQGDPLENLIPSVFAGPEGGWGGSVKGRTEPCLRSFHRGNLTF